LVPGSVKLLAVFFPTAFDTAKIPIATTIQAATTVRLCAIVQRAILTTFRPGFHR
jgi:hypothetical protein